jgi:hypothetical protein
MTTDLSTTITPKSDQLNADDFIGAGPRTITITDVRIRQGDQPVLVHYDGDNGKPWLPCKSMRRVLVQAWGPDGKAYVGRRVTLYRDPEVRFGSDEVGGIRISHMSDIKPTSFALTVTKGKRKAFRVESLGPSTAGAPPKRSAAVDVAAIADEITKLYDDLAIAPEDRKATTAKVLGSDAKPTAAQLPVLCDALAKMVRERAEATDKMGVPT